MFKNSITYFAQGYIKLYKLIDSLYTAPFLIVVIMLSCQLMTSNKWPIRAKVHKRVVLQVKSSHELTYSHNRLGLSKFESSISLTLLLLHFNQIYERSVANLNYRLRRLNSAKRTRTFIHFQYHLKIIPACFISAKTSNNLLNPLYHGVLFLICYFKIKKQGLKCF